MKFEWEKISDLGDENIIPWERTYRARVPDGWIIKNTIDYNMDDKSLIYKDRSSEIIFISDSTHSWSSIKYEIE